MGGMFDGSGFSLAALAAADFMAFLGSGLYLRCLVRAVHYAPGWRPTWLALGAASMGCGMWTMHFITMVSLRVGGPTATYEMGLNALSLVAAIAVPGIAVFVTGYGGATPGRLVAAGMLTGLGTVATYALGVAALQVDGTIHYSIFLAVVSVAVAVVGATAAFWAAVPARRSFSSSIGAILMTITVAGVHDIALTAVNFDFSTTPGEGPGNHSGTAPLTLLIGTAIFLFMATGIVLLDPALSGEGERGHDLPASGSPAGRPVSRTVQ